MSHALLASWNKTLRRHAKDRAVTEAANGESVSFLELDERANAWRSTHLTEPASLRGRAVIFAAPNGIAWLAIFLGLLKAGAIVVPLDAAEPLAAQRKLAASLRAGWWDGVKFVDLPAAKRHRDPALCLIKLTSGTTGEPRALRFTAAQLLADARQVTTTMGISRRDLNYALIPFGHSYGLGNLTIPLLAQGIPLICGSSPLPHAIAADFAQWQPTVFPGVPAMWRALAASDLRLDSLRRGISAGAPLPPEVARDFAARFKRRLHNFYGSSETGGIAYDATGRATLAGSVGRALRGVSLKITATSRLEVTGAAVLTHGNRRRRGKAGAWIMADAVTLNTRGEVTLLGRRGQTVKIAGRRVNLAEVASALRQIAGVRDVWIGVSSENEPQLGAVVVTSHTVAELRAAMHATTASWKIPKKWRVVPALPLTARGKTDARTLQTLIA